MTPQEQAQRDLENAECGAQLEVTDEELRRALLEMFERARREARVEALEEAAQLVNARRGTGETDLRSIVSVIRVLARESGR